jgi:hypothetical protein
MALMNNNERGSVIVVCDRTLALNDQNDDESPTSDTLDAWPTNVFSLSDTAG